MRSYSIYLCTLSVATRITLKTQICVFFLCSYNTKTPMKVHKNKRILNCVFALVFVFFCYHYCVLIKQIWRMNKWFEIHVFFYCVCILFFFSCFRASVLLFLLLWFLSLCSCNSTISVKIVKNQKNSKTLEKKTQLF